MVNLKPKAAVWISLSILLASIFATPLTISASSMKNVLVGNWTSTWHAHLLNGQTWTDDGIYQKIVDSQTAFCVEHGIEMEDHGTGWNPSNYSDQQKDELAEIAYFGYQKNPTNANYGLTQMLIWEKLGDELISTDYPDFASKKAKVMQQVNTFNTKPSFAGQTITLNLGDSITLTDKNKVLASYIKQTANTANLTIQKDGNTLKLTANQNAKATGKLSFAKADTANIGTSLVYSKGDQQKLVNFKLPNGADFNLNIKVNQNGNLKAKKIDRDTHQALPGAKLKFAYDGKTTEVVTGSDGYATLNNLKAGTKVTVTEVTAPNGYVNKGESATATIKPNQTIEVVLGNQAQLGNVELTKIGRQFGSQMFNKYYSLNGAIYGIYSNDGQKMGTITTDSTGKGTLSNLKLGHYYAVEEKAPAGYQINSEHLPFELKYAGQTASVTTTSIKATDEEQLGQALITKVDVKTGKNPQGAAQLDGAIYELHRQSNHALIKTVTIKNGQAAVDHLALDDYYWVEKQAPVGYQKDPHQYAFQLKYGGEKVASVVSSTPVKEHVILGSFDLIKSGNYDWHKGKNNQPIVLPKVEFTVTSDTTHQVIQKGLTNQEGYLQFQNLPYDTYTVSETKTPEGYQKVADFKVTIHQPNETHHYSVINQVIEEKLRVVKVDAKTGKTIELPNAAFKIKSLQSGKFVSMTNLNHDGKTDTFLTNNQGYLLTSETLAYGKYELIEVKAPAGYDLAKKTAPFTVDGRDADGIIKITFKDQKTKVIPHHEAPAKIIPAIHLPQTGEELSAWLAPIGSLLLALVAYLIGRKHRQDEDEDDE